MRKREELVETALELFYRDGFHATGIDKVLATAGVAKMTLYKHFRSKEELILAAMRLRDERFRNGFMRSVEQRASTPREQLLAMFDVLGEWFDSGDFRGCLFINASAEFGDPENPIHRAAAEHKRLLLAYMKEKARALGTPDPEALAAELMLLKEGAIVMAYVMGDRQAARRARSMAAALLAEAGRPRQSA